MSELHQPKIFVSKPIKLDTKALESKDYRADLIFHDVDHAGASYDARIFLNNPTVNHSTEYTMEQGYAGFFSVLAHGGCYGDVGHCAVKGKRKFDFRGSHPLTPAKINVDITKALKKVVKNTDEIIVTVVPIIKGGDSDMCDHENPLKFKNLSLTTYV